MGLCSWCSVDVGLVVAPQSSRTKAAITQCESQFRLQPPLTNSHGSFVRHQTEDIRTSNTANAHLSIELLYICSNAMPRCYTSILTSAAIRPQYPSRFQLL